MTIITTDVPPPPPDAQSGPRPTGVALVPQLATTELLSGAVVLVIDALRASTTIVHAMQTGARRVRPTLTVAEAIGMRARLRAEDPALEVRLGGERGGVKPEGFDAGNSPADYATGGNARITPGCTLIFTSTNGTGTLLHAAACASEVLVATLRNRASVCQRVASDDRPVLVLCAGTRESVSMEDALVAGAIVDRLLALGRSLTPDDAARMCVTLWRVASATTTGVVEVFRESRGGRNLVRLGLDADIEFCAQADRSPVVPRLAKDPAGWMLLAD